MLRNGRSIAVSFLTTSDDSSATRVKACRENGPRRPRTVNGTVVVAVAKAVNRSPPYVLAGVPNPVLSTVVTIAFAMLPFGAWDGIHRAASPCS